MLKYVVYHHFNNIQTHADLLFCVIRVILCRIFITLPRKKPYTSFAYLLFLIYPQQSPSLYL